MSWNLMLGPWQLALLLAIPPAIVLLYFLKLKRQPLEVPSTYLWRRSIEDLRVNSIWQRLRKNLLLLLQIFLILLALLALFRPSMEGTQLDGERLIFLVDTSASMSANDVKPSRLDEAKRRVSELIDQMDSDDMAMIVSFSDNARVEQIFTTNRRELHRALAAIAPTMRTTSLLEALRVAAGLANPGQVFDRPDKQVPVEGEPATLYIVSDGKFPEVQGFALGNLKPVYMPIGEPAGGNVGITAMGTRRMEDGSGRIQVFGRLENSGAADAVVEVRLDVPGASSDYDRVTVKAKGNAGVTFELGEVSDTTLKLSVRPGGSLAADDVAWTVVNPPKRRQVLFVTTGNGPLQLALATKRAAEIAEVVTVGPERLTTKEYKTAASGGAYDLVIFDRCQPDEMPQANTWFIGAVPRVDRWKAGAKSDAPQVMDIESAHPIMQLIDLGNVRFAEGTPLSAPPGSRVLIDSDAGPIFTIGPRLGFEDAVMGVEIVGIDEKGDKTINTDWPLRLSFPVFVLNAVEYLAGGSESAAPQTVQPGRTITLRGVGTASRLTVRSPAGKSHEVARDRLQAFPFNRTDELGVYEAVADKDVRQRFAVNLFDSLESNILPRSGEKNPIRIGHVDVVGQATWEGARRELWKPILLAALAVLLAEWYIYNRRVYV